jgi:hypothetical protein
MDNKECNNLTDHVSSSENKKIFLVKVNIYFSEWWLTPIIL